MKNKTLVWGLIIISALSLAGSAFSLWKTFTAPKIAFVDLGILYNEFTYTKELEKEYKTLLTRRQSELDSLQMQYNTEKNKNNRTEEGRIANEFSIKQQSYSEESERYRQEMSNKIWKQLSQYLEKFGEENNYAFILGATGNGNIMFSDKKRFDVTEDVLKYVNQQYNGQ